MKNNIPKQSRDKSGVYKITNKKNGSIYIGSARFLGRRFSVHRSTLESGNHDNLHLQRSYKKYGAENFEFDVIECVDIDVLLEREQFYLDQHFDHGVKCYNMNPTVQVVSLNNKHRKNYVLVDPDNNVVEFKKSLLTEVVLKINEQYKDSVSVTGLHHVLKGRSKSHKKWRTIENIDYNCSRKGERRVGKFYDVKLLSPDGVVYGPIQNLREFCRDHNIDNSSHIFNLLAGRTKYIFGWSIFAGSFEKPVTRNAKTYDVKIQSPDGNVYGPIVNLKGFCRDHGLDLSGMQNLIAGKKKTNCYKSWKLLSA